MKTQCQIMKAAFLIISLSLIFQANLRSQWKIVNDGNIINTIDFVNQNTGWMAGDKGYLLKTEDGGITWEDISSKNKEWDFQSIDFVNDTIGWAIKEHGDVVAYIFISKDGGRKWEAQYSFGGGGQIKLQAVNDKIVYAVNVMQSKIIKTTDGGLSWDDILAPSDIISFENVLFFLNQDTGIVMGNDNRDHTIYRTYDGGLSWNINKVTRDFSPTNIKFITYATGYFLNDGILYETDDFFSTWKTQVDLSDSGKYIRAFHLPERKQIMALINCSISKSYDGGLKWEVIKDIGISRASEAQFYCMAKNNWYLNTDQIVLKSSDRGKSWNVQKIMHDLFDVCFLDGKKGFVLGGPKPPVSGYTFGGNVYRTTDGGINWDISIGFENDRPLSCFFINNLFGFVSTYVGSIGIRLPYHKIYQTSDGGDTWTDAVWWNNITSYTSDPVKDLFFLDSNNAFALTDETIYRTTNGGDSWEIGWNYNTCNNEGGCDYRLRSIFFINESTGWAVGDNGVVFRFPEMEIQEEITLSTDLYLNKVIFIDKYHGWITGGRQSRDDFQVFHPVFLKTEDGGISWIETEDLNYFIHDFYFMDNIRGLAVGEDQNYQGVILETTDGGTTWSVQMDSLSPELNAIKFNEGTAWAVGDNGLILTNDPDYTLIPEQNFHDNNNRILLQNYPNPFGMSTTIPYELNAIGKVEMSIYNCMGQKIATLVKETEQPGKYRVEWSANGNPAGVYICKIEFNGNTECVKIVKLE